MKLVHLLVIACALFLNHSIVMAEESVTLIAEDDWYPYSAARGGKAEGLAIDIIDQAYKAVGVKVTYKTMPYARGLEEVKKGNQVGVFDTTRTSLNENDFVWPKEDLFQANIVIFGPASSTESGLTVKSLVGKSVGITNGYEYGSEFDGNKDIKKDPAADDKTLLKKLANNRTQYAVIYDKVAKSVISENSAELSGKVKQVGTVTSDKLYISFSKSNKDAVKFRDLLDKGLAEIKKNGEYKKVVDKWDAKLK